jgi:hypothetical protein
MRPAIFCSRASGLTLGAGVAVALGLVRGVVEGGVDPDAWLLVDGLGTAADDAGLPVEEPQAARNSATPPAIAPPRKARREISGDAELVPRSAGRAAIASSLRQVGRPRRRAIRARP